MTTYIIVFGTLCAAAVVTSTKCPLTTIGFVRKEGGCHDYESGSVGHSTPVMKDRFGINAFADNLLPFCEASVCGDGRHRLFCTTSGTSDGDCITGDAVEGFERLYVGKVENVAVKKNGFFFVAPELVKTLVHEFTTEDRSIKIYEHGNHKGESLTIRLKKGQCINLPTEWQMRVSSYGAKNQAIFYTGENCTGHSVLACRDFTKSGFGEDLNNLWGWLCSSDNMNDNSKSFKFE